MNRNRSQFFSGKPLPAALVALLILSACTRAEFGGHVFVVKGGGDVKPAAGERVYLLPYADKAGLRSALLEETISSQFAEVAPRMIESCKAGAAALEKELKTNEAEQQKLQSTGDISEAGCATLEQAQDEAQVIFGAEANTLQQQIEPLRSQLSTLREAYSKKLMARASELKASAEKGVSIRYKPDGIGSMAVTIRNTTSYCVGKPGTITFDFYQKGTNVGRESSWATSDADGYGFDLGCLVKPNSSRIVSEYLSRPSSSGAETKLKAERYDLSTTKVNYSDYFVFDEITSPALGSFFELNSQASGNRVNWTAKPVDWDSVAKRDFTSPETAEIGKLETEISAIEAKIASLASSKNLEASKAKTQACFAANDQLEQNLSSGKALNEYSKKISTCNVTKKNMSDIWFALKDFESTVPMSFMIPDIALSPYAIEERFSEYLTSKGVQTADVGIDGKYLFKDVPKKKALLYARYEDSFTKGYWLVPVDLAKVETKDLNNNDLTEGNVADDLLPTNETQPLKGKEAFVAACIDDGETREACNCAGRALQKNFSAQEEEAVTAALLGRGSDISAYVDTLTLEDMQALATDLEACAVDK